jgi:starvation-inducible DNA-binding protein
MPVNAFGHGQAGALDGALASLLDLSLLTKHAHWNVVGPRFASLHELLDELSGIASIGADRVAERAVTLGHAPDGRAPTVATLTSLPSIDPGAQTDSATLVAFLAILDVFTSCIHAALEAFESDLVTVDLFTHVLADVERCAWMLRAQRDQ